MTEPQKSEANNLEWLSKLLDSFFILRSGLPNDDLEELKLRNASGEPRVELELAITAKINEMLEQTRADEWQKIHTPYRKGQIKGQYKILEPVRRVGKNTKFKVECVDCGLQMFRYANKFEMNHKNCVVA